VNWFVPAVISRAHQAALDAVFVDVSAPPVAVLGAVTIPAGAYAVQTVSPHAASNAMLSTAASPDAAVLPLPVGQFVILQPALPCQWLHFLKMQNNSAVYI